jgi:two-component system NtrC family sensor kinase
MKSPKMVAAIGLALVLAAILALLYYKTDTGEFRRQIQILGHLRELKSIDARWDSELLRLRGETSSAKLSTAHLGDSLKRAFAGLEAEAAASAAMSQSLQSLKAAFTVKAELMEQYRTLAAGAKEHLEAVLAVTPELNDVLRQTRVADPRQRERVNAMEYSVGLAQTEMLRFNLTPDSTQRGRLEAAITALKQADMPANPGLPALMDRLSHNIEGFFRQKVSEHELYARLVFLTAGPRLDTATATFHRELEASVQEKELFRTYLIAFAGSLLILVAHIGARLRQSYTDVAAANAALKTANESLEHRVQERTRDLTKALEDLEESQAMLVQTEKMSSLGQMVAGIAHEINTPLAYVKNSLETVEGALPRTAQLVEESDKLLGMLREGADEQTFAKQYAVVAAEVASLRSGDGVAEMLKLVKDGRFGIAQIAEIVTNLRNFSRLDRSKVDRFNIVDGLESTLSIAKHVLRSVAVHKRFATVPPITCSPSQLNQVFLNLVTNAAQATEGKAGEITITTRAPDPEHVEIEVADNGKGIAPDVLPKIFDPFFTTKEVGKGTGLGLSIAYKIVEGHGGRITVHSTPGEGTRFVVTLPVHPPAPPAG